MKEIEGRRFIERNEVRIGDQIRVFEPGTPVAERQTTESWTVEWKNYDVGRDAVWFTCEMGVQVPVVRGEEIELVSRLSERRAAAAKEGSR